MDPLRINCKGLMAFTAFMIVLQIAAYFGPRWASVPILRWQLLTVLLWNIVLAARQKRDGKGLSSWSWLSLLLLINCSGNLAVAIFLTVINPNERIPCDLPDCPSVPW